MAGTKELDGWMRRLKAGDATAFEPLYRATKSGVFYLVLSMLRDYQAAEDVTQDTYLRIYERAAQYADGTNAMGWIVTMARRLALNELEKRKRTVPTEFDFEREFAGPDTVAAGCDTPVTDLALRVLDEEEFRILMLCENAGYKRREVAELLQMPIGTVTWKLKNALKKLRERLEKEER